MLEVRNWRNIEEVRDSSGKNKSHFVYYIHIQTHAKLSEQIFRQ